MPFKKRLVRGALWGSRVKCQVPEDGRHPSTEILPSTYFYHPLTHKPLPHKFALSKFRL